MAIDPGDTDLQRFGEGGGGPLVICTAGSSIPEEIFEIYRAVFRALGVRGISHAAIPNRENADDTGIAEGVRLVRGTSVNQVAGAEHVLVTGGTGVPTSALMLGVDR